MEQPRLIPETQDEIIGKLTAWMEKHGKHSFYCRWNSKGGGFYERDKPCTCGLDELLEKYGGDNG